MGEEKDSSEWWVGEKGIGKEAEPEEGTAAFVFEFPFLHSTACHLYTAQGSRILGIFSSWAEYLLPSSGIFLTKMKNREQVFSKQNKIIHEWEYESSCNEGYNHLPAWKALLIQLMLLINITKLCN